MKPSSILTPPLFPFKRTEQHWMTFGSCLTLSSNFTRRRKIALKDAAIVIQANVESALVKSLEQKLDSMTDIEKESFKHLEKCATEAPVETADDLTLAERDLKKRRTLLESAPDEGYIDVRFILPTSNICETIFSKPGYALYARRRGIPPANFRAQMLLHINADHWGISDINNVLKGPS